MGETLYSPYIDYSLSWHHVTQWGFSLDCVNASFWAGYPNFIANHTLAPGFTTLLDYLVLSGLWQTLPCQQQWTAPYRSSSGRISCMSHYSCVTVRPCCWTVVCLEKCPVALHDKHGDHGQNLNSQEVHFGCDDALLLHGRQWMRVLWFFVFNGKSRTSLTDSQWRETRYACAPGRSALDFPSLLSRRQ